ncbi:MAG: porin, partial [Sedimenticola sp.]|nr:porin [Sedimenticola sp.]
VLTNGSRIGLKGDEDLGNGLKAIFQYEFATNTSEGGGYAGGAASLNNRLGFVGLTGGFGTVAIGRQWTPYYGSVDKTDIMDLNPSQGGIGGGINGNANSHYLGLTRTGNALAYVSPNFNGLTGKVALVIDDGRTAAADVSDGIDAINVSLDYNNGPLSVGFSVLDFDSALETAPAGADRWGLAGKYNFGNFALMAQYEDRSDSSAGNDGSEAYGIGGQAYFGNNTISVVYGQRTPDVGADLDSMGISFRHDFSKRTRIYATYEQHESSSTVEPSTFGVGLRHAF